MVRHLVTRLRSGQLIVKLLIPGLDLRPAIIRSMLFELNTTKQRSYVTCCVVCKLLHHSIMQSDRASIAA
jgi:hypothetical protein